MTMLAKQNKNRDKSRNISKSCKWTCSSIQQYHIQFIQYTWTPGENVYKFVFCQMKGRKKRLELNLLTTPNWYRTAFPDITN